MNINTQLLNKNKYSRPGSKRSKTTKIAWHYIGNPGTSAIANRNYFNNAPNHKTYASSHYIIGLNGEIIQCIPEDEIAYTTNDANSYSIGIEMCHPDNSGKFNLATYNAAVELGADLAKRYKLNPLKDFIRHYDVTKKSCPKYWVDNPKEWEQFKQDVYNKINTTQTKKYTNCVLYGNDADRVAAEVIGWAKEDCIVKHIDNHTKYEGSNLFVVGGSAVEKMKQLNNGENYATIKGENRYETVRKCLEFVGK